MRESLAREHMVQMQTMAQNKVQLREVTEIERHKTQNIIEMKNNEMDELVMEFRGQADQLKNEIVALNNQIVHITHLKKIEVSDTKMHYENLIDQMGREFDKERQLMALQNEMEIKKLLHLIEHKENDNDKIG